MTKDRCTRCGLESYGLPARSLSFGRWRHTDTDVCMEATGLHTRLTADRITDLEHQVQMLIDDLPPEKRAIFDGMERARANRS